MKISKELKGGDENKPTDSLSHEANAIEVFNFASSAEGRGRIRVHGNVYINAQ